MPYDSRQDAEKAWQQLAAEIVVEKDPVRIVKLAKALNVALENQRIASKNNVKANEPEI